MAVHLKSKALTVAEAVIQMVPRMASTAQNPDKLIFVGIDPGSLKTGFGVIEVMGEQIRHLNHGVILLADEITFAHRLLALSESLQMILKKYEAKHVIVEKIFLGKNPDSAFKLGHARGIAFCEAVRAGAQLFEYSTREVKKGVAGSGAATKEQVQLSLKTILRLGQIVNMDAGDALAMAVYHAHEWRAQTRISQLKASSI